MKKILGYTSMGPRSHAQRVLWRWGAVGAGSVGGAAVAGLRAAMPMNAWRSVVDSGGSMCNNHGHDLKMDTCGPLIRACHISPAVAPSDGVSAQLLLLEI